MAWNLSSSLVYEPIRLWITVFLFIVFIGCHDATKEDPDLLNNPPLNLRLKRSASITKSIEGPIIFDSASSLGNFKKRMQRHSNKIRYAWNANQDHPRYFFITKDGYMVTSLSQISEDNTLKLSVDGTNYTASIVKTNAEMQLALGNIPQLTNKPYFVLGNSTPGVMLRPESLLAGLFAKDDSKKPFDIIIGSYQTYRSEHRLINTDIFFQYRDKEALILDSRGRLVAMVLHGKGAKKEAKNKWYLPINALKKFIEDYEIHDHEDFFGMETQVLEDGGMDVVIDEVIWHSVADKKGLHEGHVIEYINGKKVTSREQAELLMSECFWLGKMYDDHTLLHIRGKNAPIRLHAKEDQMALGSFGLIFRGRAHHQIVVAAIKADSPAQTSALEVGDVITTINGVDITHVDDFLWGVQALKNGEVVKIGYERKKGDIFVTGIISITLGTRRVNYSDGL